MIRVRLAGVATALVVATAGAGCAGGGSDTSGAAAPGAAASSAAATPTPLAGLDADAIWERARSVSAAAEWVRMRGSVAAADGGTPTTIDVVMSSGARSQATIGGVRVVRDGSTYYVNDPTLGLGAKVVWTRWPTDLAESVYGSLVGPRALQGIFTEQQQTGPFSRVEGAVIDGIATVGLRGTGAGAGGAAVRVDVAERGTPYVLRIQPGPGTALTFSDWGRAVDVELPPAAQVTDLPREALDLLRTPATPG